ncbi:laccase 2 [Cristinia sonorae]|uniref:laccase n=1 Tax=Cristinia sonorae TaxID=1940300 RepID=A0A8K0UT34_9AGAR|nr:laccase 2 [Cristinia sonorae]
MAVMKSLATLVALSISVHAAVGPVTDLHITNANISPDGNTPGRPAVLAGGTFPGPTIKGNKGDNFQITVINELTNPDLLTDTSIVRTISLIFSSVRMMDIENLQHWHGFFQKGTNWADGPAFVTQCPIITGNSFDYNFNVPDQAGTFWYHSHLSTQYCDGLRGAFVVYDPNDPHADLYDVDDDNTIITLADWYHTLAQQEPVGGAIVADATLINGLGRTANGPASQLSVINVQAGKRYRIRLVSISCDPNYLFSIDGHNMTIIEVEGVNSQPLTVNQIQIFAAQRYSFVLDASQPVGNYWIRAQPNSGDTSFNNGINSAILRYEGAPDEEPTTTAPAQFNLLLEPDLHPLEPLGVPGQPFKGGADFVKTLDLAFDFARARFTVDNVTFVPPTVPVLLQILSGASSAQDLLPAGSVIELPANKVIEISLPGGAVGGGHPFHLHGHNFAVVQSANSTTPNFVDPIWRDVVNIGIAGDDVTIRFVTDNPGPWFLHCHIDWHLEAGFAVVFAEDIPDTAAANPVPPSWSQLCPDYNSAHNISTSR